MATGKYAQTPNQNPQTPQPRTEARPQLERRLLSPHAIHHTLFTIHLTPYTLHPTSHTLHAKSYTLHPTPVGKTTAVSAARPVASLLVRGLCCQPGVAAGFGVEGFRCTTIPSPQTPKPKSKSTNQKTEAKTKLRLKTEMIIKNCPQLERRLLSAQRDQSQASSSVASLGQVQPSTFNPEC